VDVLVGVDAADDSALLIGHDWLPFFARQWGIAPPAGTGGQDTQGADKAPIRSRPSDRSVRIPGQEPGRQISFKARGQSHRESDPTPKTGDPHIMSVTPRDRRRWPGSRVAKEPPGNPA
jgi:hypothetical protein